MRTANKYPCRRLLDCIPCSAFTWLGQPNHLHCSWSYPLLSELYLRQYFIVRPQFLFAEPSYIGMHIFGVLLPLYWLSRDKRLIFNYHFCGRIDCHGRWCTCSTRHHCGVNPEQIVLIPWKKVGRSPCMLWGITVIGIILIVGGITSMLANPRVQSLLQRGIFAGDTPMSARMFRSLAPLEVLVHTIFGFSAGKICAAIASSYDQALNLYTHLGGTVTTEITELENPFGPTLNRAGNVFTMNAYVSLATEFGYPCSSSALFWLCVTPQNTMRGIKLLFVGSFRSHIYMLSLKLTFSMHFYYSSGQLRIIAVYPII